MSDQSADAAVPDSMQMCHGKPVNSLLERYMPGYDARSIQLLQ
jgi:hypothetical protein